MPSPPAHLILVAFLVLFACFLFVAFKNDYDNALVVPISTALVWAFHLAVWLFVIVTVNWTVLSVDYRIKRRHRVCVESTAVALPFENENGQCSSPHPRIHPCVSVQHRCWLIVARQKAHVLTSLQEPSTTRIQASAWSQMIHR